MNCIVNDANINLSEDEEDVLQELINVAHGNATAVIADILHAFASLSIPKIKIMQTSELVKQFQKLENASYFFSSQAFVGEFSGESAFFIDEVSAHNLAKHLDVQSMDDLDDALLEINNILTSSLTSRLAQEMGTKISFSLPSIAKLNLNEAAKFEKFQQYSQAIVIDTELNFKEQQIHAEIFILTEEESILWMKKQLNSILETLT